MAADNPKKGYRNFNDPLKCYGQASFCLKKLFYMLTAAYIRPSEMYFLDRSSRAASFIGSKPYEGMFSIMVYSRLAWTTKTYIDTSDS